jgi:hypothetical protein
MKKLTILTALLAVFAMVSMAGAQDVAVTFDEAGTITMAPATPGQVNVFVVGYGMTEISGYEFLLVPSTLPAFFLGKVAYGIAPLDLGTQYEVRAGTGGCVFRRWNGRKCGQLDHVPVPAGVLLRHRQ